MNLSLIIAIRQISKCRESAAEYLDLRRANLEGANLRHTDLWRANLRNANLWRADLRGTILPPTHNKLRTPWGWAIITHDHIQIGCQSHAVDEWACFADDEIKGMARGALE